MTRDTRLRWAALLGFNLLCWCMLGLQQPVSLAQQTQNQNGELPFANSVSQRFEIIEQLKLINAQLKEQTTLLRSGTLKVVVSLDPQAAGRPGPK